MGATGFSFETRKNGEVVVLHHGTKAVVLRGHMAAEFLAEVAVGDAQQVMARVTGNYRRGNERVARSHPRNRGRGD